ncbi:uncharacterized protein LOC144126337 [Amblyomma americanum]
MFGTKAVDALESVFERRERVSLSRLKSKAKQICSRLNLAKLVTSINAAGKASLDIFFTAKTHKADCPLRVIVTENGTWQKALGQFLQSRLKVLALDDPFLLKDSSKVLDYLKSNRRALMPFSVGIKDLYYSLPHDKLLSCVESSIDAFGSVAFQNSSGMSVGGFLELLTVYLNSTFVKWGESSHIQKSGVCIGSCIAPILSDIYLAHHDRLLAERLPSVVTKVFRFVDDYLVLLADNVCSFPCTVSRVLSSFKQCLSPLMLTHETPESGSLRFLDLRLSLAERHLCWRYEPRGGKSLLPYSSAHSKIVKRGIANLCFTNALKKSCLHSMGDSFNKQSSRLERAGYPKTLLISVAEGLLKKLKGGIREVAVPDKHNKVVVIPYLHAVSHRLKRICQRADVRVVFSAPDKLSKLCHRVNAPAERKPACPVKHRSPFVSCKVGVVYKIPLSCGRAYTGQTGRCLNERLMEHSNDVSNTAKRNLGVHCLKCPSRPCKPLFQDCTALDKNAHQSTREIMEALHILKLGEDCVSSPSIALTNREVDYLGQMSSR